MPRRRRRSRPSAGTAEPSAPPPDDDPPGLGELPPTGAAPLSVVAGEGGVPVVDPFGELVPRSPVDSQPETTLTEPTPAEDPPTVTSGLVSGDPAAFFAVQSEQPEQLAAEVGSGSRRPMPAVARPRLWPGAGRVAVWAVPGAAILLALGGSWGWPRPDRPPAGASPGTWLAVTVAALALGAIGAVAIMALLAATPGRPWAVGGVLGALTGTILVAPVLGVVGLARPAIRPLGQLTRAELEQGFLGGPVARGLAVGGMVLLGLGWLAIGTAVIICRRLSRVDGAVILGSVVAAAGSAVGGWQFLLVVAAMGLLAAGLGLALTAGRLTAAGPAPAGPAPAGPVPGGRPPGGGPPGPG